MYQTPSSSTLWALGSVSVGALGLALLKSWALLKPSPLPGIPHLGQTDSILGDLPALKKSIDEHEAISEFFFEANARRLGPIYQVFLGPFTKVVVISDAQELEDLLLRRGKSLLTSKAVTDPFGGVFPYFQLALPTAEMWKRHRRLTGASMTSKYLRAMSPHIADHMLQLVAYWREKMTITLEHGGTAFAAQEDLEFTVGDVIGLIFVGDHFHGVKTANDLLAQSSPIILESGAAVFPHIKGSALFMATRTLFESIGKAFEWPPLLVPIYWFVTHLSPKWASAARLVKNFVRHRIFESRERVRKKKDSGIATDDVDCVLDMVMGQEGSEDMNNTSEQELIDEFTGLIFAVSGINGAIGPLRFNVNLSFQGQETTAVATTWGLKYLSNNKEVQVRLREELLARLPNSPESRPLTYEDVMSDNTPYLEAVVAEILRCANIATFTVREAAEDVTIFGRLVPKGTLLALLNGYAGLATSQAHTARMRADGYDELRSTTSKAMGPSKGLWDDSDVGCFKPERWLIEMETEMKNGEKVKVWKFSSKQGYSFPFSMGQRTCFGYKLATLEMKILVATLVLAFFFDKLPEGLNSFHGIEILTRQPKMTFISPKPWSEASVLP